MTHECFFQQSQNHLPQQEYLLKRVPDLIMIYFISPKQPTNLQANLRIVQLVKRLSSNREVVGSIPVPTICFFRILLFISKEKVRECFFAAKTNQPTSCYFGHNEVRSSKKWAPVLKGFLFCHSDSLRTLAPEACLSPRSRLSISYAG